MLSLYLSERCRIFQVRNQDEGQVGHRAICPQFEVAPRCRQKPKRAFEIVQILCIGVTKVLMGQSENGCQQPEKDGQGRTAAFCEPICWEKQCLRTSQYAN